MEPTKKNIPAKWDVFLKHLTDKIAEPSQERLSVRCLTQKTLVDIFGEIKSELKLPSTFPNGKEVLGHLQAMGLASPVAIDIEKENAPSKQFYLVGISESHSEFADQFELLQAYKQSGVICYFSAISYYNLTTQLPTHHHIATISTQENSTMSVSHNEKMISDAHNINFNKKKNIGTLAFYYKGIPYYLTSRNIRTIQGVKKRIYNPRTWLRITSVEQTLLDTLQYPIHCGGPEVIFEAWNEGIPKMDESAMLNIIKEISLLPLTRRVGAVFDFLDYNPSENLKKYLDDSLTIASTKEALLYIPLLRGINFVGKNNKWKVLTP